MCDIVFAIDGGVFLDLIISNLRIPVEKDGIDEYVKAAAQKLNISENSLKFKKILSKSLDARSKKQFYYEISLVVSTADNFDNKENYPPVHGKNRDREESKKHCREAHNSRFRSCRHVRCP